MNSDLSTLAYMCAERSKLTFSPADYAKCVLQLAARGTVSELEAERDEWNANAEKNDGVEWGDLKSCDMSRRAAAACDDALILQSTARKLQRRDRSASSPAD